MLDTDALCGLPAAASPAASSFESDPAPDELAPQTGARFGHGLQVRFADGTRGVQWSFTGHTVRDGELRLQLADRRYPLAAELGYRVRPGSDVIERWVELTHTGADDSGLISVDRLDSASWTVPALRDYRLNHLVGGWNSEFQLQRDRLPVAETVLTSRRGVTSHHTNPWLALDDGTADEEHGEVWGTALAWSGSWRITVHRDPVGRTTWTGGFGHEGISWTIQPGQSLRTPVFAGLYTLAASAPPAAPGTPTSAPACCPPPTGTGPSSTTRGKPPASTSANPASYAWPGWPHVWAPNSSCWTTVGSAAVAATGRGSATGRPGPMRSPTGCAHWPTKCTAWAWPSDCGWSRKWSTATAISTVPIPTGSSTQRLGTPPSFATSSC